MSFNVEERGDREASGRQWRFGQCEFDESSRQLKRNGQPVDLESKPLDVLQHLLLHAGEVVTKEELLDAVWPGLTVVEGSLATAVSKLRKAVGEDPPIVVTVPRIGYRLGVPAQSRRVAAPAFPELEFQPGDPVAGRDQWVLVRRLDVSGSSDVWLAEHPKTHETRVFKFAPDGLRLKGLKREVTVARFLKESLGDREDMVRVLEWNFENPPFYLESEYSGPNLQEWAESQGWSNIPAAHRLQLLLDIAEAVGAAHSLGVLHKDLKPTNILMTPKPGGVNQVKVADFGSAALLDPSRLGDLGITNLGFTQTEAPSPGTWTGTLMYLSPEVLAGNSPTVASDVYSLGVLLYQLIIGDFRKPLSPGWEADIPDALLRLDIADAASGDPAKRLQSVPLLVDRLRRLDQRRAESEAAELARRRAIEAEQRLAAARARRPWIAAVIAVLALGLAASLVLYRRAAVERDRANRQTAIAASVNQFLANDLLGRTNPFQTGKSSVTLLDAVKQASPNIDRQFNGEPEVAARLHLAIAGALDSRTEYTAARPEYERAVSLFLKTDGAQSQDAIAAQLQRAAMEARSYEQGALPVAKSILADQESRLARLPNPRPEIAVWLASARGMIALIENNPKLAAEQFQTAWSRSESLPAFDESARLTMKQKLAFTYIRLGDGVKAESLFRELAESLGRLHGPESPHVLRVRLNLAQAYMIQNKHQEAVREASAIYPAYAAALGEDHELTLQLLTTRAQSEGSLGLWDDAIRDDLQVYNIAVRKQGTYSFFAIATLSDAALAQCRGGQIREGEGNARKAYEASSKAFGPKAGLTGGTAYALAACSIPGGKLGEAQTLLRNIDTKATAQLAGFPDWGANVTLAEAEIAYRQGDYAAARKLADTAAPVFTRSDAEPYQRAALKTLQADLARRTPSSQ